MSKPYHYNGRQDDGEGGYLHLFTITHPDSPANGATFAIQGVLPSDDEIEAAVARKESEFRQFRQAKEGK